MELLHVLLSKLCFFVAAAYMKLIFFKKDFVTSCLLEMAKNGSWFVWYTVRTFLEHSCMRMSRMRLILKEKSVLYFCEGRQQSRISMLAIFCFEQSVVSTSG